MKIKNIYLSLLSGILVFSTNCSVEQVSRKLDNIFTFLIKNCEEHSAALSFGSLFSKDVQKKKGFCALLKMLHADHALRTDILLQRPTQHEKDDWLLGFENYHRIKVADSKEDIIWASDTAFDFIPQKASECLQVEEDELNEGLVSLIREKQRHKKCMHLTLKTINRSLQMNEELKKNN